MTGASGAASGGDHVVMIGGVGACYATLVCRGMACIVRRFELECWLSDLCTRAGLLV